MSEPKQKSIADYEFSDCYQHTENVNIKDNSVLGNISTQLVMRHIHDNLKDMFKSPQQIIEEERYMFGPKRKHTPRPPRNKITSSNRVKNKMARKQRRGK